MPVGADAIEFVVDVDHQQAQETFRPDANNQGTVVDGSGNRGQAPGVVLRLPGMVMAGRPGDDAGAWVGEDSCDKLANRYGRQW